ncbi:MAG: steroid 5-alpha reductase [Nitrospira bacterium SG8_35_1]|nr:MAG: steroid 5-alpha reductase [Nitrospira bacterium SG8_35_1]
MLKVFLIQSLVIFIYATAWFIVAVAKNRNDVADIAWGGGFICASLTAYLTEGKNELRVLLVLMLVFVWGLRLMLHIGIRNRGKPEDYRYRAWRQEWGSNYLARSFLQVFLLQSFLLLIISLPVTLTISRSGPALGVLDTIGFCIWLFGFLFEAIGDYQLLKFKKKPASKGKVMKYGLWRYTRHPNYFGEVTLWWGIFFICLAVPGNIWTVIGPLTITYLILKVSGTPLLEKKYVDNPEYAEYINQTSSFFPLPPKK